jgi:hypothetical protein
MSGSIDSIPSELRTLVRAELRDGESVLWMAQPLPHTALRMHFVMACFAIGWTAFSAVFGAFAVFLLYDQFFGGNRSHTPMAVALLVPVFVAPFLAIGVYLLTQPFRQRHMIRHSIFAITTRRVLVLVARPTVSVESVERAMISGLRREDRGNDTGDLVIFRGMRRDDEGDIMQDKLVLGRIKAPRMAERALIRLLQSGATAAPNGFARTT